MTYPVLPMAIVTYLAGLCEQRAALPAGPTHVTVLAHHGEGIRSKRFAIVEPHHWNEMIRVSVDLYAEAPTDTMTILFPGGPSEDGTGDDFGIILEGGREPGFLQWTWSPRFSVRLVNEDMKKQLRAAEGVKTLQALLDKDAAREPRKAGSPRTAGAGGGSFLGAGFGG